MHSNSVPCRRYLSSIGLLNRIDNSFNVPDLNGTGPKALVFGGDGGLLHNSLADISSGGVVSNALFDDVWLLALDGEYASSNDYAREKYCNWRLLDGSKSLENWSNTCGWQVSENAGFTNNAPEECSMENILTYAWCNLHQLL